MNDISIKPKLKDEICFFARKYGIKKVILFGSRARGDYKNRSDIDLAVTGGDFPNFYHDINEETSTLLKFDIVNLDLPIQTELLNSIQQDGKVLYEEI